MSKSIYASTPKFVLFEKTHKLFKNHSVFQEEERTMLFANEKILIYFYQNIHIRCVVFISKKEFEVLSQNLIDGVSVVSVSEWNLYNGDSCYVALFVCRNLNLKVFENDTYFSQNNLNLLIEHFLRIPNKLKILKNYIDKELEDKALFILTSINDEQDEIKTKIRAQYSLPDVPKDQSILQYHNTPI